MNREKRETHEKEMASHRNTVNCGLLYHRYNSLYMNKMSICNDTVNYKLCIVLVNPGRLVYHYFKQGEESSPRTDRKNHG